MNLLETRRATLGNATYSEIVIDGVPLARHFIGRKGAHPSGVSPLGWSPGSPEARRRVDELLGESPSELESGRVPVLVCEECGDIGCGAIAVRVIVKADQVTWTDWAWENGYEDARDLEWASRPADWVFDWTAYAKAIRASM